MEGYQGHSSKQILALPIHQQICMCRCHGTGPQQTVLHKNHHWQTSGETLKQGIKPLIKQKITVVGNKTTRLSKQIKKLSTDFRSTLMHLILHYRIIAEICC